VEVAVREGARATLTTQAAEKLYRARVGETDTRIHVDMRVGPNAWAEWLAQETILFDGARMRRSFHADVDASGRLLAVETAVFGRTAMGETFASGLMHDSWRVRRGNRLIWVDAQRLEDDITAARGRPFGFGTAVACSTVVYVGVDAARLLETTRDQLRQSDLSAAATSFDGLLLVRVLSEDAAKARSAVRNLIAHLRSSAAGLPARVPRVWDC
jgi:urease accessory protein